MKIAMLGNFEPAHSTENDYKWSYEDLGHEVLAFQENKSRTEIIYAQAKNVDIFHYVHTHGWETPGDFSIEELIEKFKSRGIKTISVHLDYWRGLVREKDVGNHPFWKTEYVFTADGGSNEWYREQGINHYYLRAGVIKRDCYLGDFDPQLAVDVAFVGAKSYHPEWAYRPKLINWLVETYGDRFKRFASDTGEDFRGKRLNDLYASAKVVVGDTLCLGFNHPDYFSDRLYETTGRGGFMIFPYIKGLEESFSPLHVSVDNINGKQELVAYNFNNFKQLEEAIDLFVKEDEIRIGFKARAMARTKSEHTYNNRIEEILSIIFKK